MFMVPKSRFGRTNHYSSRIIFGAAGLGDVSQGFADRILNSLFASGINHIDTAASYGDAEVRIAPFIKEHRAEFFLATKLEARSYDEAKRSIEQSLERLGVEKVDLLQLHNLVDESQWRQAHSDGGALKAVVEARSMGLTNFIGVTGHGAIAPRMHIRSLREFDYDSVLFPYNFMMLNYDKYADDVDELLGYCNERDVAVQTIKGVARRNWQDDGASASGRYSWYEPLTDDGAIRRAVGFVLARPNLFLNSSSDYSILEKIVSAAQESLEEPDVDALEQDVQNLHMQRLFNEVIS